MASFLHMLTMLICEAKLRHWHDLFVCFDCNQSRPPKLYITTLLAPLPRMILDHWRTYALALYNTEALFIVE